MQHFTKIAQRIKESFLLGNILIRCRLKTLDVLVRLVLPSYCRVQPGLIRSIVATLTDTRTISSLLEYHLEYPASVEYFKLPDCFPPAFHREFAFQPVYTYLLRDVGVGTISGNCFTEDGKIFAESSLSNAWEGMPGLYLDTATRRKVCFFAPSECVTVVHSNIYYHFLLDEIPRILRTLRRYPQTQLIVYSQAKAYITEILSQLTEIMKIEKPIIRLPEGVIYAGRYAFSASYHDRFVRKEDIQLLRKTFLPFFEKKILDAPKKVFISRRFSSRAFENEDEIEKMLVARGVQIIYLERLSWMNQVEIFTSASTIIASHGGGLANMVWCSQGTKIIEIFQQNHFNDCFTHLAIQLELDYQYLWSSPGTSVSGKVDLVKLDNLLQVKPT